MHLTLFSLGDYCGLLDELGQLAAPLPDGLDLDRTVELVSYHSKEAVPGTLFICKGAHFKPDYLADAARRGAFAYVSETAYPEAGLPCILVKDMRRVLAPLAVKYYNEPSQKLKVIGVTGTKGKSSTAYYLKHILDELLAPQGKSCGVISSIDTWDGVERFESHLTTPEPLELQKHFAHAAASGMEYLVMEVSSQALKYHRTLGTRFAAAAFLNIGADHISPIEHPDFEDYFGSKLKIFAQADFSCVNLDCEHAAEALESARSACGTVLTFSRQNPAAAVYGSNVRKVGHDILFQADAAQLSGQYRLTMPGLFNVDNALAAIAVCRGLDIPKQAVLDGLSKARVPGRMEVYSNAAGDVTAIVDYAHNGASFESILSALAEHHPSRILLVFGAGGDRPKMRRTDMARAAARWADYAVLTADNPRSERVEDICSDIAAALGDAIPWEIIPDRRAAIFRALSMAEPGDAVALLGKGHEGYIEENGVRRPWSEQGAVEEYFAVQR